MIHSIEIPRYKDNPRAYMNTKNAERRARCKLLGLCKDCATDKATIFGRCVTCRILNNLRRNENFR